MKHVRNNSNSKGAAMRMTHDAAGEIVRAGVDLMDEVTNALRRRAAHLGSHHESAARPSPPPPVAGQLHSFAHVLAKKVAAIDEQLRPDERDRVHAIAPSFVRAVLGNDPDVVQMVTMLLSISPGLAALWIATCLDVIERRFAS